MLSVFHSYTVDACRFYTHMQKSRTFTHKPRLQAHMLLTAHALEKGMALPAPRPDFGEEKANELLSDLEKACALWGVDAPENIAYASLAAWHRFHKNRGAHFERLHERLGALSAQYPALNTAPALQAGIRRMRKKDVLAALPPSPEAFFNTRRSVRMFGPRETFDYSCLERAVRLAQECPSVCNRQTTKAYIYTDPDDMARILEHQNGNKGFGDTISAVVICTSNLHNFFMAGERNQGYVDGGLFAMALTYAFHTLGVGTCMLNWSQPAHKDKRLRKTVKIPENEVIITMIAVGPLPDEYDVAASPRKPLSDVLSLNDKGLLSPVDRHSPGN